MARRPPALGFQDDRAFLTPGATRDRLVQQMLRQGARDVRLNVIYGQVKQGGYDRLDEAVNYLRAHGIRPQMTIMGTPRYMPNAPQELSYRNANPALMGLFAKEVAGHFKGRVRRYSAGNEPNYSGFNYGANTNPERAARVYRQQYRQGYAGIKSADPSAQVMLGELAPGKNVKQFMDALFAGKQLRASGFAYHPYDQAPNINTYDIDNLPELQQALAHYKRMGKFQTNQGGQVPLYLTEFGTHQSAGPPAHRLRMFARGYAQAREAGARQILQYGLLPVDRPSSDKWVWDTSIGDAAGNIPVINRGLRLSRGRRVAGRRASS